MISGLLSAGVAGGVFAADPEKATDTGPRKRIVILGDSITAGYGLDRDRAYPAVLQKKVDAAKLPYTVVNAGVSGDTTAGGLRRVEWAIGAGADVLVIALGGNDGLRGIPPTQTATNLEGIIRRAREKSPGVRILLAGMRMGRNMGADYTREFEAVFPAAARAHDAVLIPFLLEDVGGVPELNQSDAIHPNAEGQKRIAETVWKVLEPVLRQPPPAPATD